MVSRRNSAPHSDLTLVTDALDTVRRVLSPPFMSSAAHVPDYAAATRAIERAWEAVDAALAVEESTGTGGSISSSELLALTVRLRRADDVIRQMESKRLSSSLELVREALARFDGVQSVNHLVRECPRAVSALGFDRGMLSLVEQSVWTPASAYSERRPEWAQELVATGQGSPQALIPSLPEFELVRRSRSILVTDVQENPKMYKEVIAASQSRSYVAAGVTSDGVLIGLIHADKYFQGLDVDEFDRSVLGLFAEAFGHVLARVLMADRSSVIRGRLTELTAEIGNVCANIGRLDQKFTLENPDNSDYLPADAGTINISLVNSGLTRREIQVLQMMANGLSNIEIATRLFIAPGTVKSHVKHILRKLGAANRAEAVSRWFSSERSASR